MRSRSAFAACACAALVALPTRAEVEALGFSADGKYAVLLEHGVADGSGFPWARVTTFEAAKNAVVGKPIEVVLQAGGATEAQAVEQAKRAFEAARVKLNMAALRPGKEIRHDEKGELHDREGAPIGTLKITARRATAKEGAKTCYQPFSPLLLSLTLYWMDDDKPAKLLAERRVPKDRACLTGCDLGKTFADGTTAIFVLQCGAQGFEGTNSRAVPVAAHLLYGLDEDLPGSDAKPSE